MLQVVHVVDQNYLKPSGCFICLQGSFEHGNDYDEDTTLLRELQEARRA